MKLATGVDLIEIARINEVVARHGKHYLERVFTPAELEYCGKRADPRGSLCRQGSGRQSARLGNR